MTIEPIKGKCPECFQNGAPVEALDNIKKLVDGVRCGPCYRIAAREGRVPKPPKPPKTPKPPKIRPKSEAYLKKRAEEEALGAVIADFNKGTHFLVGAAESLGWTVEKARHVYGRMYDRGLRRKKSVGGNVLTLLKESPRSFEQLRKLTGMTDGGVYAALRALGDKVSVTRNGKHRVYSLVSEE